MRRIDPTFRWLPFALFGLGMLTACSSPSTLPAVDESSRRPANTATAVELQVCRNDLQNTRLLATESGRLADMAAATLAHLSARQQLLTALRASSADTPAPASAASGATSGAALGAAMAGNRIHTLRFDFGSSHVSLSAGSAKALLDDARQSPLVLLRGRTDGDVEAPAEARIARDRALAVRDLLVAAGVNPTRIRATWQGVGDGVAENNTAAGRSLNRRVEIEIYRVLPAAPSRTTAEL